MNPETSDSSFPGNFPRAPRLLTGFIGREAEIETLATHLADPGIQLLTIVGPGGIGKSRLALEVASRVGPAFPEGILLVPLSPINDPELVAVAIARALRVEPRPDATVRDCVVTALHDRRMLLILDNLEHVLSAATFLHDLLISLPTLTILGTSRTRLAISGEHVFALDPLAPHDARALFRQRASLVHIARPAPDDAVVIDAICAKLDHLPLAIELAAARTATLPPETLLSRLDRPLSILRHGPRDLPRRQQTMRDTVAWSYGLLDEQQQAGFRSLAVFVGGFTIDAAQAVLGPAYDAFEVIDFLVAHSLVVPMTSESGIPRFTMLESIRQFGVDMLHASDHETTIRTAHADHLITFTEVASTRFDGPDGAHHLAAVRDEMPNVRAAIAWAVDHRDGLRANRLAGAVAPIWSIGMMLWHTQRTWKEQWSEGVQTLGQTLALRDGNPSRHLIGALTGIVWLLGELGDPAELASYAHELLERSVEIGHIDGEYTAHVGLAVAAWMENDPDRARREYAESRTVGRRTDTPDSYLSNTQFEYGRMELALGESNAAQAAFQESLERGLRAQNQTVIGGSAFFLAMLHQQHGNLSECASHALMSLDYLHRSGEIARAQGTVLIFADLALLHNLRDDAVSLLAFAATVPHFYASTDIDDARIAPFRAALPYPAFCEAWEAGTHLTMETVGPIAARIAGAVQSPASTAGRFPTGPLAVLSARELEVLALLVEGISNRAIGERLFISERTVEKHMNHIMMKLDCDSRTSVVAWAVRNGVTS